MDMKISQKGIDLIKKFEGLRLEAYPDPGTGGDPWTIGYGTTKGVRPGMVVTEERAEELLVEDVAAFEAAVRHLLPIDLTQSEFDALVSFTYNCGAVALEESTLRKRLLAGEPRCWVYQKEFPRWNKGGSGVLLGLVRRRQAEADLACLGYLSEVVQDVLDLPVMVVEHEPFNFPLDVPYFTQTDSQVSGQAERMCFSSSMAMAMDYLDSDAIEGDDDWYLNEVFKYGDTVSSEAQLAAARSLGFDVEFRMDGTQQDLIDQLDKGIPVPIGILHHGDVDHPTGGGHWICLIGYDEKYFHVHDPMGDLDLVWGGYPHEGRGKGANLQYTRKNLMKRWHIDGSGADGWWMELR